MNAPSLPQPLPVAECLRLLTSVPVGRIVYTRNALPAVEPVKFILDGGHIFAAAGPASSLPAAIHQSIAAFQADHFAADDSWTVTAVGDLEIVTDPAEIEKLHAMGLTSWTTSGSDQFLHIRPGIVTGQRWGR